MKTALLVSSLLAVAVATGAQAQSQTPSPSANASGVTVGPATGTPDTPTEPPAAKVQQPGKEGQQPTGSSATLGQAGNGAGQNQSAKMSGPGATSGGTSAAPGTGGKNASQAGSSAAQATNGGSPGVHDGTQQGMQGQADGSAQAAQNQPHVTSTHELKESLRAQGFSNVKILAESFVVQASKDGKQVTMVLGPQGLSAYQIVDENGLQDDDETTGSVSPQDPSGSSSGQQ